MKPFLLAAILSIFTFHFSHSQTLNPTHWSYTTTDLGNGEFEIDITCMLDPGWHIFSKDYAGISVPASLSLEKNDSYEPVGDMTEVGEKITKEIMIGDEKETSVYYEGKVVFVQKIKLLKKEATIKGGIEYMTCKEVCVAPETFAFSIDLIAK
ncbi:MAG TPA: hypothetical protein DCQ93_08505 [Bacteroidetes bacterium]|nr:hypothetical protein [Bacteroidota bacterium]